MSKDETMDVDEQQLFLMEFLIDRVNVPSLRAMRNDIPPSTTCVSFQILNLQPINIYQDDDTIIKIDNDPASNNDKQIFKKGKSCLFALPTIALEKPLKSFPVTMTVYKKLPPGVLPDAMPIGNNQIEMKDIMNLLIKNCVFMRGNPSKKIKDTFKIKAATGQIVGSVTIFIRVSCFGKKIVTQFQIPYNHNQSKPYLFKGADNSRIFQCKKISHHKQHVSPDDTSKSNRTSMRDIKSLSPFVSDVQKNLHSNLHTDMQLNNIYSSGKKSSLIIGDSSINLESCGCPQRHV